MDACSTAARMRRPSAPAPELEGPAEPGPPVQIVASRFSYTAPRPVLDGAGLMYGVSRNARLKLVGASLAALAVAGGGVAIAATKPWSPRAESQAVINDAAKQLGVTPTQLSNALKRALKNRVDDAV